MNGALCSGAYSSLPNRRNVTAIHFLIIFHPQPCYLSHHIYQKWRKLRTTTLIPGTTFIKIKESSRSASHNSVNSATASLKIRERFRCSLCTRKNKSFECEMVINCFENIYYQMYIRLNTGVPLI